MCAICAVLLYVYILFQAYVKKKEDRSFVELRQYNEYMRNANQVCRERKKNSEFQWLL